MYGHSSAEGPGRSRSRPSGKMLSDAREFRRPTSRLDEQIPGHAPRSFVPPQFAVSKTLGRRLENRSYIFPGMLRRARSAPRLFARRRDEQCVLLCHHGDSAISRGSSDSCIPKPCTPPSLVLRVGDRAKTRLLATRIMRRAGRDGKL